MVAGAFSGLVMASVCGVVMPIVLFRLFMHEIPLVQSFRVRVSPMVVMIGVVVLSYPLWILVGILLSLLYMLSVSSAGESAIIAYHVVTLSIALAAVMPVTILLRRMPIALISLALIFIADFSLLLPVLVG